MIKAKKKKCKKDGQNEESKKEDIIIEKKEIKEKIDEKIQEICSGNEDENIYAKYKSFFMTNKLLKNEDVLKKYDFLENEIQINETQKIINANKNNIDNYNEKDDLLEKSNNNQNEKKRKQSINYLAKDFRGIVKLEDIDDAPGLKLNKTQKTSFFQYICNLFKKMKKIVVSEKKKIEISLDYINKLLRMLSELDESCIDFLKFMIKKRAEYLYKNLSKNKFSQQKGIGNAKKFFDKEIKDKEDTNELFVKRLFYPKYKENEKNIETHFLLKKNNKDEEYTYFIFDFEEFILLFLRYIKFLIGIEARIEFFQNKEIFVYLKMRNEIFPIVAEYFDYPLQLKSYSKIYEKFLNQVGETLREKIAKKEGNLEKNKKIVSKKAEELLVEILRSKNTFKDMDHTDPNNFPPFIPFTRNSKEKFQKYWSDDLYHNCYKDPEFRPYEEIIAANSLKIDECDSDEVKEQDLSDEEDFKNFEYEEDHEEEENFSSYNNEKDKGKLINLIK